MDTSQDSGNLLHNMLLFGRVLRGLGMDINPGRMIDLVQALDHIQLGYKQDFYHACRSLLVHDKNDIPLFDQAFDRFWRKHDGNWFDIGFQSMMERQKQAERIVTPPSLSDSAESPEEEQKSQSDDEDDDDLLQILEVTQTYSDQETLRHKDFAELTPEELATIKLVIVGLAWQLGRRLTRRQKPGRGPTFDMRRSLRRNLRYGGEMVEWPTRKRKDKPRPLVVIADISGSMERYTRLLLHFIYGLSEGLDEVVEAFVFSTRLTHITRQLRNKDVDKAMKQIATAVPDWSGGTRIGEAFKRFNYDWGRRVLGRGAVVLIISDGWDRGEPEVLSEEMARLQRSCYRLIWLNPLLGSPHYEPLTRGIQAALPYIDDFLPVHNLASLEELAAHLAKVPARGGIR
ncbi:MAG: VWA domain-containing protein [Candidatus Promineifilaceae bacterium]